MMMWIPIMSAISLAGSMLPPDDIFAPIRIDCDVSATRHYVGDAKPSEPWGTTTYIFLFPNEGKVGDPVHYVWTADDGRSWLSQAPLSRFEEHDWPRFSAVVGNGSDEIKWASDTKVKGRITFSAFPQVLTDGAGWVEERGTCRITTDKTRIQGS